LDASASNTELKGISKRQEEAVVAASLKRVN
jgi:hypothetical protein